MSQQQRQLYPYMPWQPISPLKRWDFKWLHLSQKPKKSWVGTTSTNQKPHWLSMKLNSEPKSNSKWPLLLEIRDITQSQCLKLILKGETFKNQFSNHVHSTLGQKTNLYPKITKNLMFENGEFCEKWDFEIVNFVKNCDFEIVNFVKNETLKLWILCKNET